MTDPNQAQADGTTRKSKRFKAIRGMTAAAGGTAIAIACFTASATWLAETYAFSHDPANPAPSLLSSWLAFASLIISLGAFWWCIRWVSKLRADTGTLYYLRLQPSTFVPRHNIRDDLTSKDARDFRAVRRTHAAGDPDDPYLDVIDATADVFAEFERSTNDDDDSTKFDIAPDLAWPIALRIGFDWTPRSNVRLLELAPAKNTEDFTRWEMITPQAVPEANPRWLTSQTNPPAYHQLLADRTTTPARQERDENGDQRDSTARIDIDGRAVRRVRLSIYTTRAPRFGNPQQASPEVDPRSVKAIRPGEPDYDVAHVLYCPSPDDSRQGQPVLLAGHRQNGGASDRDPEPVTEIDGTTLIDGNALTADIMREVHAVFRAFPRAQIDICALLPKTVAFNLGGYLGRYPENSGASFETLADVWGRARLMHFIEPENKYIPMLVHPSQRPGLSPGDSAAAVSAGSRGGRP